jgi:glycosyltransferase involved in cell wall biosynthesis
VLYNLTLLSKESNEDLSILLKKYSIDKFYSAIPYLYNNVDFNGVKDVIVTIHGLRPVELPFDIYEYKYATNIIGIVKAILIIMFSFFYKRKLKYTFQKLFSNLHNSHIIAVSEHTKYSICSFYPTVNPSQVTCLYSPLKHYELPEKPLFWDSLGVEQNKYFLIVSGKRWIKNSYRALKSFELIIENYKVFNYKIVCLGCNVEQFGTHFSSNAFVFIDYVESSHLEYFYKNCFAFLYPTLNEGFGYPPLEAMKYGKPVLSSYVNSITEICKDAPLYFNPYSIQEIANRILYLIHDENVYSELAKKSLERYQIVKHKQDVDLNKLIDILVS